MRSVLLTLAAAAVPAAAVLPAPPLPTWSESGFEAGVVLMAGKSLVYRSLARNAASPIALAYVRANRASLGLGPADEPRRGFARVVSAREVLFRYLPQLHDGAEVLGTEIQVAVDLKQKKVIGARGRWLPAAGAPTTPSLDADSAKTALDGTSVSCREGKRSATVTLEKDKLSEVGFALDPAAAPAEPAKWRLLRRFVATPALGYSYDVQADARTGAVVRCDSIE